MPHVDNHQLIVEAARRFELDLVIDAFRRDPLVKSKISDQDVETVVIEMIENTLDSLPNEWRRVTEERKHS